MGQPQPKVFPVEKVLNPAVAVTISGVAALGSIKLAGQPLNTKTLTLNGSVVTFVTAAPGAGEVQIGADTATTFANLLAFLQASVDAEIAKCTYTADAIDPLLIDVAFKTEGATGNAYTLATDSVSVTLSGATLAGGVDSKVSSVINCKGLTLVGIQLPATFTSTALTFKASIDGVNNWQQVYNSSGAVSLTVAQGHYVAVDPKDFYGISYLQLIAGSNEGADRALTVALKGF